MKKIQSENNYRNNYISIKLFVVLTLLILIPIAAGLTGCTKSDNEGADSLNYLVEAANPETDETPIEKEMLDVARFDLELDSYKPQKDHYNFYFTYKSEHAWWDAIALGMEEAQRQFLEKGITITYDYLAPILPSATDQARRLREAAQGGYDVIGVDVVDGEIISPILDEMVEAGHKVMTFSSSDASPNCKRLAYVGNTHNYKDGVELTEALCDKLDYAGKVAILVGTKGSPCHETRARGARDVLAKFPDIEVVATEYDNDSVDLAYEFTRRILQGNPDLAGIICCNMSNPVGAARAVIEMGSDAVIVGMDHDREALEYLKEGIIYCLGVQDCFAIGFDTLQVAVKLADGNLPGELFPEKLSGKTTVIYQEDAETMIELLYGDL